MWKTTIKGLLAHKLRLALTALAVVLGVGFIAGTFVLTDTMNKTFDNLFSDVFKGVDVIVRSQTSFDSRFGESRQPLDESLLGKVKSVPGVRVASGSVTGTAQLVDNKGNAISTGGAPTQGSSWRDEPKGSLTIRTGRPPSGPNDVVIDAGTAGKYGFKVGDSIKVLLPTVSSNFTISGIAGFGSADNLGGATLAVFDLATAQQSFDKVGKLDAIYVGADSGVSANQLVDRITPGLPDRVEAISGASSASERSKSIKQRLSFFNTVLLVFAGIALFVGAFLIFNTFSITVAQRTREFGLLRALGASGGQITASVLLEALLVGLFASAVGILAGLGLAALLKVLLKAFGIELPSSGLVFLPRTAFLPMAVGVVVTLVASVGPARRASSISPMAALRESGPKFEAFSKRRAFVGLAVVLVGVAALMTGLSAHIKNPVRLVGAGAVIVLLGVAALAPLVAGRLARVIGAPVSRFRFLPGKLARENAARNPRRTAATAAALMIGLALVGFVSILASSVKATTNDVVAQSFKADYTVSSSGREVPNISPEVSDELYDLPEVQSVAPIRMGQFRRDDGRKFLVVGTDPDALRDAANIDVATGDLDALDQDNVFLYQQAATDLGLKVGDTFDMEFPATGKKSLKVVGTFRNKSLFNTDYLLAIPTFEQNFPEQADSQLLVTIKKGVPSAEAKRAMQSVEKKFPNIQIEDQAQSKAASVKQINQVLALVYALLGMALIIALLGITNTLALSVFERTRELGLLRAVGMARKQTRSMVRWESVIIAIIGAVLGLLVGIFFGWAIVSSLKSQGITEFAIPGGQLILFVVLAALAGIVAAIPPARRAARLNVLEAISTE